MHNEFNIDEIMNALDACFSVRLDIMDDFMGELLDGRPATIEEIGKQRNEELLIKLDEIIELLKLKL